METTRIISEYNVREQKSTFISIIVPNYNHAPYLEQRLSSIFDQSYQDFEVIILDDHSTDDSNIILRKYATHPKVSHLIINSENSGSTFSQWEKGISLAKGEWIWIAESDDVAEPMLLQSLLENTLVKQDAVLSFCASTYIDDKGNKFGAVIPYRMDGKAWDQDFITNNQEEAKWQHLYKNTIPNASAVIFRKEAIPKNIFDELRKMRFAGDWFFWTEIIQVGSLCYTADQLNQFRQHDNTTRKVIGLAREINRFDEFMYIITSFKRKYHTPWNIRRHIWLINEWVDKYFTVSDFRLINNKFPLSYNLVVLAKILKNKIYNRK